MTLKWSPIAVVSKYDDDMVNYVRRIEEVDEPDGTLLDTHCSPYETVEAVGNLLTTVGLSRITALTIGSNPNTLDSTRVRLGTGDTATAATVGDTGLGTNQYFHVLDSTYPQASGGVLTFRATFGPTEGNYTWACWGLDVGAAPVSSSSIPATLINRKVNAFGTKSTGTWVLTVTVTWS